MLFTSKQHIKNIFFNFRIIVLALRAVLYTCIAGFGKLRPANKFFVALELPHLCIKTKIPNKVIIIALYACARIYVVTMAVIRRLFCSK